MPKTKDLTPEIEQNIKEAKLLATKQEFTGSILVELETNRLIHEQNYQELASLIVNNNKKLTKIDKKVDKLAKKESFWQKIKSIFIK